MWIWACVCMHFFWQDNSVKVIASGNSMLNYTKSAAEKSLFKKPEGKKELLWTCHAKRYQPFLSSKHLSFCKVYWNKSKEANWEPECFSHHSENAAALGPSAFWICFFVCPFVMQQEHFMTSRFHSRFHYRRWWTTAIWTLSNPPGFTQSMNGKRCCPINLTLLSPEQYTVCSRRCVRRHTHTSYPDQEAMGKAIDTHFPLFFQIHHFTYIKSINWL